MLTNKKIVVPKNLINLAKKTTLIPAGIVCAHHESTMISAQQAYELSLINPTFIGNMNLIQQLNLPYQSLPNSMRQEKNISE